MTESFDYPKVIADLTDLIEQLPDSSLDLSHYSSANLTRLKNRVILAINKLTTLSYDLDPIKQPDEIFDPSDPRVIGQLIALTLLERPKDSLGEIPKFYGSGVYAIYYNGTFNVYGPISNSDNPIYVGKADPADPDAQTPEEQGDRLSRRLAEHARSINHVRNLQIEDFACRYLVVKSAWQNTAEDYLINRFKPVWNNQIGICYGFGKHGDKSTTRKNTRSPWDTLHPGRPWADDEHNIPNPKSPEMIGEEIRRHFIANPSRS